MGRVGEVGRGRKDVTGAAPVISRRRRVEGGTLDVDAERDVDPGQNPCLEGEDGQRCRRDKVRSIKNKGGREECSQGRGNSRRRDDGRGGWGSSKGQKDQIHHVADRPMSKHSVSHILHQAPELRRTHRLCHESSQYRVLCRKQGGRRSFVCSKRPSLDPSHS